MPPVTDNSAVPGSCFKFTVRSADEAVRVIREQLGENAKVISVRQVEGEGFSRFFSSPRLEVIAQIENPAAPEMVPAAGREPATTAWLPPLGGPAPGPADVSMHVPATVDAPSGKPLAAVLRRSGMSEGLLARLEAMSAWTAVHSQPLHRALPEVAARIKRLAESLPTRPLPLRAAFIGLAGSGRTTALCKWLALQVVQQRKAGSVVKAEFDRPNAAPGLDVFCELLGVPVHYYPGELPSASASTFCYVDLPGLSLNRPEENRAAKEFLDKQAVGGRVLVLNAAYDTALLRQTCTIGRELGATHLVFSHLDEVPRMGQTMGLSLASGASWAFLGTGPSLTGDCEVDVVPAVLRKTFPGA